MDQAALADLTGGLTAALVFAHRFEDAEGRSQCGHLSSIANELERCLLAYSSLADDHELSVHGRTVQPGLPGIVVLNLADLRD